MQFNGGSAESVLDVLDVLLETAQKISAMRADDSYEACELLRQVSGDLATVDSFYVCLYVETDGTLFFCYNFDNGVYDEPVTVPLGKGPTSWVVRNKRPFVLSPENGATQRANIPFGDPQQQSRSAVHVPLLLGRGTPEERVVGVMSAQSYQPDAYDPSFVRALQWLADHAGPMLVRAESEGMWRRRAEAAEAQATRYQEQAIIMANTFVQTLKGLTQEVESLRPLLPTAGSPTLHKAVESLCHACYRSQTQANQLPLQIKQQRLATAAPSARPADLPALTKREQEIVQILASGASYAAIAEQLHVSLSTVKFHCNNLFRKLGVSNRYQAAHACSALLLADQKT